MRRLLVAVVLGILVSPAAAESARPEVTVNAGAVLPVFLLYESPGPWVAASVVWAKDEHVQLVANADVGVLAVSGATRIPMSIGAGARVTAHRYVPVWVQLGVGLTVYVERIGVALPERTLRETDRGAALTADLAIGLRVTRRWEVVVGYDHQLVSSELSAIAPRVRQPHETLPFLGTAMISVGRQL
jgi:hypothetical protein